MKIGGGARFEKLKKSQALGGNRACSSDQLEKEPTYHN